ncbi:MAG: hypothetical protein AAFP02_19005, partial [Bacteroidota bacterium]
MESSSPDDFKDLSAPATEVHPGRVLITLALAAFIGFIVANLATAVLAIASGWDLTAGLPALTPDSSAGARNQYRLMLLISHIFLFILPAYVTCQRLYPKMISQRLYIDQAPRMRNVVNGILLLLAAMPLVQF